MFAKLVLKCTALKCRDRPDLESEVLPELDEILHRITSAVNLRNPKLSVPSHFICPITQVVPPLQLGCIDFCCLSLQAFRL
jgi:hypothetical protein